MRNGIMLNIAALVMLGAGTAAFLAMTVNEHSEPSQPAVIIVNMETTTTSLTASEYAAPVPEQTTTTAVQKTSASVPVQTTVKAEFPININTAGMDELMQLPGIGETIAGNIISYRESCGGFTRLSQLLEVNGIGEGRYEVIVNMIYIDADIIIEETAPPEESAPAETTVSEIIPEVLDVNQASTEEFDLLPGVDRELAENIVELRRNIGGFANVLELLYAEGMTRELYISIMDYIECKVQPEE